MPEARVAGPQQHAATPFRDARPLQRLGADAAGDATNVGHPRWTDEAPKVEPVDAPAALDEMARRIDVGAGVRPKAELAEVDAVLGQSHGRPDPHRRVAPIDGHRIVDRHADVDDRHASAWRRTSATLHA